MQQVLQHRPVPLGQAAPHHLFQGADPSADEALNRGAVGGAGARVGGSLDGGSAEHQVAVAGHLPHRPVQAPCQAGGPQLAAPYCRQHPAVDEEALGQAVEPPALCQLCHHRVGRLAAEQRQGVVHVHAALGQVGTRGEPAQPFGAGQVGRPGVAGRAHAALGGSVGWARNAST